MARSVCLQEAADEMSVNMKTVQRLLDRGELRGHRVGRATRVYLESIEDYQRRHEIVPKAASTTRRIRKPHSSHLRAEEELRKLGI